MTVCITGAAGFVGSHIVAAFLDAGYRVRATVRNTSDTDKTAHLQALSKTSPHGQLEIHSADLLKEGSFDGPIAGCEGVIHVAATLVLAAKDPQKEIVEPAVSGVKNVLAAAHRSQSVKKVVLTSSAGAISSYRKASKRLVTEADWNDEATLQSFPYEYAKTLEERVAMQETVRYGQWDLVSINPTMVLGPLQSRGHLGASPQVIRDLLIGTFPACPKFYFGIVDVRDVALAHLRAYQSQEAKGRYLLCAGGRWMQEMARLLKTHFPDRHIATRALPTPLLYLAALFDKRLTISTVAELAGKKPMYDGVTSQQRLGLSYRDVEETIVETARSMLPYI